MLDAIDGLRADDDVNPISYRRTSECVQCVLSHAVRFVLIFRHADCMHHRAEPLRHCQRRRQRVCGERRPVERYENVTVGHRRLIDARQRLDADAFVPGYSTRHCRGFDFPSLPFVVRP